MKVYKNKKELIQSLIGHEDTVLDVGFWGQGTTIASPNWVHKILLNRAAEVYGLDIDFDVGKISPPEHYKKGNAENFDFDIKFDVIFAADLIEHLSNPGMFLQACARNLKPGGRLIVTTPNCFNFFSLTEKLSKTEPTVNRDHVCYFNNRTIKRLLEKNNWQMCEVHYLYLLERNFEESIKKKILNIIYFILSKFTAKFLETMVVVAEIN